MMASTNSFRSEAVSALAALAVGSLSGGGRRAERAGAEGRGRGMQPPCPSPSTLP